MKITITVLMLVAVLVLAYFFVLGYISRSGSAPGRTGGNLAPCPDTPNCVCSEYESDESHYIAPLEYSGVGHREAWQKMKESITENGGKITTSDETYLAATFSVAIFGFIDDVECRLDTVDRRIHIRSASRVGNSDLDVNRRRVEKLARHFSDNLRPIK